MSIEKKINQILGQARPSLQMHGGDVNLKSYKDGVVYLEIKGACQGCPMAAMTFGQGIGEMLKQEIKEVREIRY